MHSVKKIIYVISGKHECPKQDIPLRTPCLKQCRQTLISFGQIIIDKPTFIGRKYRFDITASGGHRFDEILFLFGIVLHQTAAKQTLPDLRPRRSKKYSSASKESSFQHCSSGVYKGKPESSSVDKISPPTLPMATRPRIPL